jgi:capsular exopolysaccharide synthesis family protein
MTPLIDGYILEIENSYKEKVFNYLFHRKLFQIESNKLFPYDKIIETEYFKLSVKKIKKLTGEPIYFRLNGDSRYIYKNFIVNKLTIRQKNKEAPIIDISYEDNVPQRATEYVNKLIEIFEAEGKATKSQRNINIEKFLEDGLRDNDKELQMAEDALEQYKIKNKIIETSAQLHLINKDLNNLEMRIADNRFNEIVVDNILQTIGNQNKFNSIGPLLTSLGDDIIIKYLNKLQELKAKENHLSSEYTDEYPELMVVRKDIEITKENIYLGVKSLKDSIIHKKQSLYKLKNKKDGDFNKLPVYETNIVNLTRKYKKLLEINDYFFMKKKENDTIKAAIISDYNIVEEADQPKNSIKPKRFAIQVLSLILGLVIGVLLSLIHYSLSDKIKNSLDIEKTTTLELYGIIPFFRKQRGFVIEIFNNPQSKYAESFRRLRTNLQFLSKSNNSNIILVTSIKYKEGKSAILANLSAILQLSGYKTIVIDLDLYNPSLHSFFDIDYSGGISEYLSGKENLSDIIFSTIYPDLDIIPAGAIPINPSELILSKKVEIMLDKLKERYDYILIDSTPVGSLTDTLNLIRYADINLVVFKANKARKTSINKLEKMITKYNLKNIGLILNSVSSSNMKNNDFI